MRRHAHRARRPRGSRVIPVVVGAVLLAASAVVYLDRTQPDAGSIAVDRSATVRHPHARPAPAVTRAEVRLRARRSVAIQERLEPLTRSADRAHPTPQPKPEKTKPEKTKPVAKPHPAAKPAPAQPFDVTVGTFNVLGSQHTGPGGDRGNFPPASVRTPKAAALMIRHGVDIIGTQEDQTDQLQGLQARTGFAAYPGMAWGSAETDNSILYDPQKFEFVSGSKFIIPFMGRPRPQPILRLRDRATGREFYVVNTHPSAHGGRYEVERRHGEDALVGVVNQLKATGLPVLVTGDMNDREIFYCRVAPAAGLVSSSGGSYGTGCVPPHEPVAVDWVLGSGVTWSGYWRDTTPVTQRVSDHFMVSATAHFA